MKTASLARRWNARAGVQARYASSSLASIMAVLCAGGPAPDARGVPPDAVSPPLPASVDSWKDMLDRDRASAARQAGPEQAQEAPLRALDAPPDGPPDATFQTAPRAAAGATPAPAPQTPTNGFQAITRQQQLADTSTWWYPPDTMGAVGTNHFVEAINGSVAVYVKATGSRLSHVTLNSFFTATIAGTNYPRNGSFDPRILYDRRSQRWFATALERGSPSGSNNHVLLAVSATADPTGSWYKYVVPVGIPPSGSVTNFSDFETLGTDDNGVYVGVRIFPTLSATHAKIAAMQKAPLLSGTASTVYQWTSITDMYSTPQPVHNLDPVAAGDRAWFVASSPSANADVRYRRLTWSGGVPTLDGSSTTLTTPSFSAVKNAPALGSTVAINVGDARLQMAAIRGGRLWTCRNVAVNSAGGSTSADRTGCEWLQLDVSGGTPSLVQSGRVYDTTSPNPRFYYYPSIMVNGQGHAVMAFSGSRTNEYVGAYFTGRLATDSAGSMGSVAVIKSGEAAYQYIDSSGRNRWGDYSYTSLDPNDDMSLWTIQEYASSATSSNWATWVARLLAPAPTLANPAASAYQGQTGVVLNLTGTGHYDPGPGFPNRQTVALTGGSPNGISNYAVTNINATLTRVTFDVAANAALGPRDVVLTNPDGQTATVLGGFTIQAPADLSIAKTASPDPVTAGNTLAYHIVVSNRGPASSGTVTVTDPLPPGITFVSAATSQGTWTNQNGTIICELGALASNGVATVTLLTMPTQSGTIDNTASVDGSADPNGANDSATAAVTVPMDADSDGVPDAWELTHGMSSANGGDAATDPDGDGISSLIEYRAGTDPNNTTSFFRVLSVLTISNDVRITWQAGGGRTNRVQAGPSPTAFQDIGPSFVIPGETDLTTNYLDVAGGTNAPARFYRIRIQP